MTVVRPEQPGDVAAIHAVHAASFPTDAEARLVSLLRAAGHLPVSLVAEADGAVVGHVAFSPVSAATGAVGAGLAPVAVLESHRRQGIAARLSEAGLAACRSAGFGWAVVLIGSWTVAIWLSRATNGRIGPGSGMTFFDWLF